MAFFEALDKAQSEPLDRLDRAQAKLDAWASNHHPKPNPLLAGMMDFNTQALPDIPGTVNDWTAELDDKTKEQDNGEDEGTAEEDESDDEEEEEDEFGYSFVRPGKFNPKAKSRKEGAKALGIKSKMFEALGVKGGGSKGRYKTKGCAQQIARSPTMDWLSIFVVFSQAIWIGVDTNYNTADSLHSSDLLFVIVEQVFCIFFVFEIVIRFAAFKYTCFALTDGWWLFDFVLVVFMVLETWILFVLTSVLNQGSGKEVFDSSILRVLKMIRLARVARIARLLRVFPELMVLLKGIIVAARSVFFTLLLLAVVMYIFTILFVQLSSGSTLGNTYFSDEYNLPSVSAGMYSLFIHGCFYSDLNTFARACFEEHFMFGVTLLLFLVTGPWTVMNMLVGVLVQVVAVVAAAEEDMATRRLVFDQLMKAMVMLDENGDEILSQGEFTSLLQMPDCIEVFNEADIDVVALAKDPDIIFAGEKELPFKQFAVEILQLRGSNAATVKDITQLRKQLYKEIRRPFRPMM